jgi:adenylate cyclase
MRQTPWFGLALVLMFALPLLGPLQPFGALKATQAAWQRTVFDGYQWLLPRQRSTRPVVIVAIDDYSLERLGQWPWSRTQVARLIEVIGEAGALAIGIDILFREPDRLSPENYARSLSAPPEGLVALLETLPRHDQQLSAALASTNTILGVALSDSAPRAFGRPPPAVRMETSLLAHLPRFPGAIRSLPSIERGSYSVAMMNAAPEDGVIRRVPLLARHGDGSFANLGLETLRTALGDAPLETALSALGNYQIKVGDYRFPIEPDGRVYLHFATQDLAHRIPAASVLEGSFAADTFRDKLVLVGFMAQGELDRITTPLGDDRPGVEVHAELIESIVDGQTLGRPNYAWLLEALLYLLLARGAIVLINSTTLIMAISVAIIMLPGVPLLGLLGFHSTGLLFDTSLPTAAAGLVFASTLARSLAQSQRERRELTRSLQLQRELEARINGELAAAKRIQMGLLPNPESIHAQTDRIDIASHMEPARSVGGDLYDYFVIDQRRLFVCIGDVSDKGVPASLFMALTKTTTRSAVLDFRDDLALAIDTAQGQIQRDNPESMFITLAAVMLDLDSGAYRYVNAGHEEPLMKDASSTIVLDGAGGPPLCALDSFPYPEHEGQWPEGGALVLVTDGVTEALDPAGALYGRERLKTVVENLSSGATAQGITDAIRADVLRFAHGRDLPDDMAIVVVRWMSQPG